MKENMLAQCLLKKEDGGQWMAWIDVTKARKGAKLRIKENGKWMENVEVMAVYSTQLSDKIVAERGRDHVSHRLATDI